ncbi:MAG: chitobiase/beta-hexosaminidase C-terminal domain-containing protein [Terracidiphilus sp.]|jgi:LysM repeat protein
MSVLQKVRRASAQRGSSVRALFGIGLLLAAGCLAINAQVSVTTWRYDIGRTGQNLNETILTPSNVNPTQFGMLFSQPVDGYVYAEPLYLPNVTIGGQSHNVVYVATEHDSVYAFDADTNGGSNANPLWLASMLSTAHGAAAGATTVSSNTVGTDIVPEIGITGTPVIDTASGTLYVVSATQEGTTFIQRLHALDVTSGAEKYGGPAVITATTPGTGNGSSSGTLTFDSEWENQRPGLLLLNGIVWIGYGSHGDNGPWHGWILGYNEATLQQTGVFCTSPNGEGSGVWMSGAGLAADVLDPVNHPYGRMFVATGNGDYTATIPYAAGMDYGDSILDLDLTNGVPTIQDEFTPMNQATLDAEDGDQASGGLMIVPTQTTGSYPYLLVQAGKSGSVYLLNRQNLGGYNPAGDQVVQELPKGVGNVGTWNGPAYFNGTVYYWGEHDTMKAFPLVNGLLTGPTATSSETYTYPGANPVISASGSTQGIVWALETDEYMNSLPSVLTAHLASTISTTLYSSATNPSRDTPGNAVKFTVPTVVNGKVYVGSQYELSVYGLLNGEPQAAEPVLSPSPLSFSNSITVSMTDATPGATIYYTLNGTAPSVNSPIYTTPIAISTTTTIQAMASAPGYLQSGVSSGTYVNTLQTAAPTFSPDGGTFTQALSVTISDASSGATIYYTTDGSTPTTASTQYTGAVTVGATEILNAIAVASGFANSDVASATYTINTGVTGIDFPVGFAETQGIVILNGSTDLNDSRLQLTNGATGEASSAWYYQPVNIQAFTTDFSFQLSNPAGEGITFAIQRNGNSALGEAGSGLGYQGIPNSIAIKFDLDNAAGEGTDSTGLYANGVSPTIPAIDLSTTGIDLHSDDTMDVTLTYNGAILSMVITDMVTGSAYSTSWPANIPVTVGGNTAYVGFTGSTGGLVSSQKVLTWVYTTVSNSLPVTTSPVFNPPGGAYSAAQSVSISSGSSGAAFYYTTDGTTPTTSSAVYSAPITVSASETLKSIAVVSGYGPSAVGTATYSIAPTLPAPVLSPSPGTYTTAQTVTISDTNTVASIYYTTDGTTPTTSSSPYSGPITVSASETVEAIVAATGYNNSPIAGGTYTIAAVLPAPTFSLAAGTYTTAQSIAISDSTAGTVIYYTTNGTTPTTASSVYGGPITVSATETLEAIAVETGYTNSAVTTVAYTIKLPGTTYINYLAGGFTSNALALDNGASVTGGMLQLTDGGSGEDRSAWFAQEVAVQSFITNFTFEQLNALADGMTFTIQSGGVWALGDPGGGLGYQGIADSVAVKFDLYNNAGEGSDSTGLYTGGAAPTVPAIDLSSTGINLHSGDIMSAQLVYDGTNLTMTLTDTVTNATVTEVFPVNISSAVGGSTAYVGFTGASGGETAIQNVLSWTYMSPAGQFTATPTLSVAPGSYPTPQTVTITSATAGATIYYTTNGTTPTTASNIYSGPITVSSTETIEAIAVETGYNNSGIAIAAYTISSTALAAPTFSPAAGSYTTAQSVTISDATSGTTIHYTTNGTTPTISSAVYNGPITVTTTETLEAIAVETGYTTSAMASAAYTISLPALPAPTLSPAAGTYTTSQSVTISDAISGATIYYTTDGTTPTTSSAIYSGPITVSATETLEAIAVETGYTTSAVSTAVFTIGTPALPAPTFLPAAGTYTTSQTVTISDATAGATIYYTTNDTTPTISSTVYSGPITVSATETLEAIAVETGYTNSPVSTAVYTITSGGTAYINYPAGEFTNSALNLINGASVTGGMLQLTDGGSGETRAAWFTTAVPVQSFITNFTFELLNASADGMTFTIQDTGSGIWALGDPGGGLGYQGISNSVAVKFDLYNNAGEGSDSTGLYTDGAAPTVPAIDLSSTGINFHSGDILSAQLVYNGTDLTMTLTDTVTNATVTEVFPVNIPSIVGGNTAYVGFTGATGGASATQNVLSWTYVSPAGNVAAVPTYSPAAGTYTTSQSVTISDATVGATIYYTTNGTTPTTSSTVYSGPITVSTTETLEAIAVETGYTNSALATAAYTIAPATLPAPTFSPAAGTYTTSQSVTIGDATSGTTIFYTTNGTAPTTSSTKYTGAITVSATETLKAFAVETGYTNSSVATAVYTISTVLSAPTFLPAAGMYTTSQSVMISDATSGATIYYTTNGTTPTTSSTKYTSPVTVSATETLKAIAVETGYTNSAVATAVYTIAPATLPAPTFSPAAGTYTSSQSVTISDATSGTTIYYTTNGTTPTTSSTVYSGPITVSATETLEAIAVETGYTNSAVAIAVYTISSGSTSYISYPANGFTASALNLINGATVTGGMMQLTNGGTGETRAAWFTTAVPVQSFHTTFTFEQLNATADGMTFTIQDTGSGIWALGDPGGGLGYQGIGNSVAVKFDLYNNAGEGSDSTGLYTDGATPTVPAIDLSSTGINFHSGDVISVQLVYNGTTLSMTLTDTVTNATVTEVFTVNIPSVVGGSTAYVGFTGATGGSTATQNVLSWTYSTP